MTNLDIEKLTEAEVPGKVLVAGLEPIRVLGITQDINKKTGTSGLPSLSGTRPEVTSNHNLIDKGITKGKYGESTMGRTTECDSLSCGVTSRFTTVASESYGMI